MAQANDREVIAVLGGNAQGKTRWLQRHLPGAYRAMILEGGFKGEQEFPGVKCETFEAFEDYMTAAGTQRPFRVRYVPRGQEEFELMCEWAQAAGSLSLFVDEAQRFVNKRTPLGKPATELIYMGRHFGELGWGVSLVFASTAPADFPIEFRRQLTRAVVFSTTEPADLEWMADFLGKEWAEKVSKLVPGRYVHWRRGVGCEEVTLWES